MPDKTRFSLALILLFIAPSAWGQSYGAAQNADWPVCESVDAKSGRWTGFHKCRDDEISNSLNGKVVNGEWQWNGPHEPIDPGCASIPCRLFMGGSSENGVVSGKCYKPNAEFTAWIRAEVAECLAAFAAPSK